MKTAKSQMVIILAVLIAFAAVLLALLSSRGQSSEGGSVVAAFSGAPTRSSSEHRDEDRAASASLINRRPTTEARLAKTIQPTTQLLQSLGTTVNTNAKTSLETETDIRFSDFLAGLSGSPQRVDEIRQQLITAYADILAFGIALQEGDIGPAEAESRADPNYVLNQVAELLTAQELTELETYMEADARERFQSTYEPQLELIGVELSGESKDRLIETLFTQTYLLVSSDGIGASSDLESRFQRQLEAIARTRDSLRVSMTPEQFEQANKFLSEQELGLLGAQTIFSVN